MISRKNKAHFLVQESEKQSHQQ